jgi:formylglycine-generating enzyme
MTEPVWIMVPGGTCCFGDRSRSVPVADLQWMRTLVTRAQVAAGDSDRPAVGLTFGEALDAASSLGGRLPTSVEWEWMAAGARQRRFPWGDDDWEPGRGNLLPAGIGAVTAVAQFPAGATPEGLLDVAGNVWEWTTTATFADGRVIRGGSYASRVLYARSTFLNAAPAELRSAGIGLRAVREA